MGLRQANIDARLALTQEALRDVPADAVLATLEAAGVPCAPVLTRNATLDHPQVVANGMVVEVEHPEAGRIRQARPAARFSGTSSALRQPAPGYGEHTEEVLREAGLDAAAIAALRDAGAFGSPKDEAR